MLNPITAVFALLTISIGEEFDFKFFKVLSCVSGVSPCEGYLESSHLQVLTGICVVMWLVVMMRTVKRAISGKMFFAPCLGTDLFLKRDKTKEKSHMRV